MCTFVLVKLLTLQTDKSKGCYPKGVLGHDLLETPFTFLEALGFLAERVS